MAIGFKVRIDYLERLLPLLGKSAIVVARLADERDRKVFTIDLMRRALIVHRDVVRLFQDRPLENLVEDILRRTGNLSVVRCREVEEVINLLEHLKGRLHYLEVFIAFDTSAIRNGLYAYLTNLISSRELNFIRLVLTVPVLQELYHYADTEKYHRGTEGLEGFPKFNARDCLYAYSLINKFSQLNIVYGRKISDRVHDLDILSQVIEFSERARGLTILLTGDYMLAVSSTLPTLYLPKSRIEVTVKREENVIYIPRELSWSDFLYSTLVSLGIIRLKFSEDVWLDMLFSWKGMSPEDLFERKIVIVPSSDKVVEQLRKLVPELPEVNVEHSICE